MKITWYCPKDKEPKAKWFDSEIAAAQNIQDKSVRDSVTKGLQAIKRNLKSGTAYFWDGEDLYFSPYSGKISYYHCGKDFELSLLKGRTSKYLLVTFDYNQLTIGLLDGKKITTLYRDNSLVPNKHSKGGQSKGRFQRARQEAIKQWFKSIAQKIEDFARKEW